MAAFIKVEWTPIKDYTIFITYSICQNRFYIELLGRTVVDIPLSGESC